MTEPQLPLRQKRRLFVGLLLLVAVLLVWLACIFWMQSFGAHDWDGVDLVKRSQAQRMTTFVLDDGRGRFVDRFGRPLGGEERLVLVVFPQYARRLDMGPLPQEKAIAELLRTRVEHWRTFVSSLAGEARAWSEPGTSFPRALSAQQAQRLRALRTPGLVVASRHIRSNERSLARHLIGVLAENPDLVRSLYRPRLLSGEMTLSTEIGVSGLERSLDSLLTSRGAGSRQLSWLEQPNELLHLDNTSRNYPLQFVTTLDADVQRAAEDALRRHGVRQGAVVVLDAASADVVAMASRPDFHPQHLVRGTDYRNHALLEQKPGSIFKTVIAVGALAERKISSSSQFGCSGSYGKYRFVCWLRSGHGGLTAAEAFAQSCNIAFAQMAMRLTPEQIERYASSLGLSRQVGWSDASVPLRPLLDEQLGMVYAAGTDIHDEGVQIQTAIGQRDVLVSPLQAANMVVTILNDGVLRAPRVLQQIRYHNGGIRRTFEQQIMQTRDPRITAVAPVLRDWMRRVVTEGTAKSLQSADWPLAGKTGTAQVVHEGRAAVHQWFIGYGPTSARYAIAVIAENCAPTAPNLVLPVVRDIMDFLSTRGK